MNIKQRTLPYYALLVLVAFLSGCAGTVKNMSVVPQEAGIAVPEEGKSMIVFMRPSTLGFAIQSSVFDVSAESTKLVGIVAAKKKVAHQLEPGKYTFMVVGESADFMSAELEPNKTYYALVTPRMGWWKARFSLKPIHGQELASAQFKEWLDNTEWVATTAVSDNWADANMASIQSKRNEYYAKWISKNSADRPKLLPEDGK